MIKNLSHVDLSLVSGAWPFAEMKKDEIADHWQKACAEKPDMWDGRVLGTYAPHVENGGLTGRLIETSFSAFLAWRDWGCPDTGFFNLFGSAIIAGNDGGYIYGIMGAHTANAGAIYPCGGSLEPGDVTPDGKVDLWGAVARELFEETGLLAADARPGGDFLVMSGQILSASRVFRFDQPVADLARRIEANIAVQDDRELAGVAILRRFDDLDQSRSPLYAIEAARHLFGA